MGAVEESLPHLDGVALLTAAGSLVDVANRNVGDLPAGPVEEDPPEGIRASVTGVQGEHPDDGEVRHVGLAAAAGVVGGPRPARKPTGPVSFSGRRSVPRRDR